MQLGNGAESPLSVSKKVEKWRVPAKGWFKVNVDAAVKGQCMALAMLVRNDERAIILLDSSHCNSVTLLKLRCGHI